MSKADKMFDDLNYKKVNENENGCVYDFMGLGFIYIRFLAETKEYDKIIVGRTGLEPVGVNTSEHLAIHEKMKELGWIYE